MIKFKTKRSKTKGTEKQSGRGIKRKQYKYGI